MDLIGSARTIVLALLVMFPAYAVADQYLGFGIGRTNNEYLPTFNPSAGESIDDQDKAFKILGGWGITPNLAVEVDLANLYSLVKVTSPTQNIEIKGKSIGLSALGKWQLSPKLQMFGRFGATRWNTDLTVNSASAEDSGISPMVGLGLIYPLPNNFQLRLEWTQYQNVGQGVATATTRLTGQNVDALWLTITYHLNLLPGP